MNPATRRAVIRGSIAATAMIAVSIVVWQARRVDFFRVRQIEVVGAHFLSPADVVRRLALRPHASTLDPLTPIRRAAQAIPGVHDVTVTRRLPGTIRVMLHEWRPVALANVGDRLVLIDLRGRVLPFDPIRAPTSLPIASRDSITAGVLDRIRMMDGALYARIQSAHPDHGDVMLDLGDHQIRLPPTTDSEVLRMVRAVTGYLDQHQRPWRELDARFRGKVFVRKAS